MNVFTDEDFIPAMITERPHPIIETNSTAQINPIVDIATTSREIISNDTPAPPTEHVSKDSSATSVENNAGKLHVSDELHPDGSTEQNSDQVSLISTSSSINSANSCRRIEVSPEEIVPIPKCVKRIANTRVRRCLKSAILTSTPEKNLLKPLPEKEQQSTQH